MLPSAASSQSPPSKSQDEPERRARVQRSVRAETNDYTQRPQESDRHPENRNEHKEKDESVHASRLHKCTDDVKQFRNALVIVNRVRFQFLEYGAVHVLLGAMTVCMH